MDQSEVQSGIPQQLFDREFALATMDQILPTPISLSSLKNMYEEPHRTRLPRARATRLLSTPQRVFVDPHFTVPTMSPELQFSSTRAHVDALLMIPNTIGLAALLPILPPDQGYSFQLHLGQRTKMFRAKAPKLGFDPKQSLLWIGRCRREDVWIALADRLPEEAPLDTPPLHGRPKDTVMPLMTYNMLVMFIAHCMSNGAIADVDINGGDYPEDIDSPECIRRHTNLL